MVPSRKLLPILNPVTESVSEKQQRSDNPVMSALPPMRWRKLVVQLLVAATGTIFLMFLLWEGIALGFAQDIDTLHTMHFLRGITTSFLTGAVLSLLLVTEVHKTRVAFEATADQQKLETLNARKYFEAAIQHSPAGMLLLDADRKVLFANEVAKNIHDDSLVGHKCYEGITEGLVPCNNCPTADVLRTHQPYVMPGIRTDPRTGEMFKEEFYPVRLAEGGENILVVQRIVTKEHQLQASILHQEKMAAFGLLAAGIAHDMGNPLASIDMHLQLIDDQDLSATTQESIATVRTEVARLRRILRELVDFARRRGGDATHVSPYSVVQDAIRLLRYDRRTRGVDIQVEADTNTPSVFVVEDHLMQVVLNILINALDAMPDGGALKIQIGETGGQVSLRILDNGCGMNREQLRRATEPLYTTKPEGHGTGLGLSICREIVESSGGHLELYSTPTKGTTVIVTLPASANDTSQREAINT